MGEMTFREEDKVGLLVALLLHVLLAGALMAQMFWPSKPYTPPERVSVSLASEVSLEATAPDPASESRAAIAPTMSETPEAPVPEPVEAQPEAPTPQRDTRPTQRATQRPAAPDRPQQRPQQRPERQPPAQAANTGGGSLIGDNFLDGSGSSTSTDNTTAPAPNFGRRERASLEAAIVRQLKPNWRPPSGVDADQLRSIVSWSLGPDGSLQGTPRCRNVASSITPGNRPQAALHCDRAIRAVRQAAPFNLPEQFYSRWDKLEWEFNIRL